MTMIRTIAKLTAFGILGLSLFVTYETYQTDITQKTRFYNLVNLPIYVRNNAGHAVPLYNSSEPYGNPVGQLSDKSYYRFQYAGNKKGDWLHGILNGQEVFIKDSSRQKVILLFDYPVQLHYLYHSYIPGLFFFILFFLLTHRRRVSRSDLLAQVARSDEIAEQEREAKILAQKYQLELEYQLTQSKQQIHQLETETKQHLEKEHRLRYEFKEKEQVLIFQFEKEAKEIEILAKRNNKIQVSNMQAAYDRLNNLYQDLKMDHQRLKAEGVVFDIDFDSRNYEHLLTGRLYEIFFAKSLLEDTNYEILHWTSDKGFEHGIKVKSNGDPDFLIQYGGDFKFAVECKYRTNFYANEKPNKLEWGKTWQAKRYLAFQLEKKIPVFVAMGISGTPEKPRHNYLVTLDYLIRSSDGHYWNNNKEENDEQQVVLRSKVYDLYIKKRDDFPKKVFNLVTEQLDADTTS